MKYFHAIFAFCMIDFLFWIGFVPKSPARSGYHDDIYSSVFSIISFMFTLIYTITRSPAYHPTSVQVET